MTDLFGTLILISLIALVVGLFKPTAFSRFIKNPTRKKVGLILGGLFIVFFIGFGMTTDTKNASTTAQNQQTTTTQELPKKEPTSAPQAPTLSEQEQIKILVTDQLKGKNNMKRDNLKKLEVSEQEGGGWNATVEFNASDNLYTNLRKIGIEKQMSELYIALYKSGKDVRTTTLTAFFPLVDRYGKENDRAIYQSTLSKEEASKVNWDADESTLKLSILPKVWTTSLLHPEFK